MAIENAVVEDKMALEAQGLAKQLGGVRLFADADFKVVSGEALIVRGTNGSGKTTLLRILAGLLEADAGEISVRRGMKLLDQTDVAGELHYLGHSNALKTAQTTRANLEFWRSFLHSAAAVEDVAEQLDLAHLLDLPVVALSAGQKRRAGFARLLLAQRPIWLLDEPTAALDAASTALIEKLVGEHLDGGGLVVAATHLPFLENRAQTVEMEDFAPTQLTRHNSEEVDW